jgi:hypothetical protein
MPSVFQHAAVLLHVPPAGASSFFKRPLGPKMHRA